VRLRDYPERFRDAHQRIMWLFVRERGVAEALLVIRA
jgi:hypothetical protein